MNLIADLGNTVLKVAVADGTTLGKTYRYQGEKKIEYICDLASRTYPDVLAVSSARALTSEEKSRLEACAGRFILIDPKNMDIAAGKDIPCHLTPDTVASIIAVRHLFKGKGCSLFDLGTTITATFLNADGTYAGNTISPGCTTRFRSISRYARNLPLLKESDENAVTGNSLDSSIVSGVVSGIIFEIEGFISLYPDNIIVFTGGDANYFAKRTKNSIFVVCNLVLMGLALIAEEE